MTKKQAVAAYRRHLIAVMTASLIVLGSVIAMLWTMPAIFALGSAGATAFLAVTSLKTANVFAAPLIPHALGVHLAARHNLRIGRARNGVRAFRLYRHAASAVRHQRAARRLRR